MPAARISIKVTDNDGLEASKRVASNTTIKQVIPTGSFNVFLNGDQITALSTQLRAGDHVEYTAKSGKAGC